jgi:broad specificity phosphatase PhoE
MTTIILVRHGQTAWNREERFRGQSDIPLNPVGVEQAGAAAERIASHWHPAAVYASPLQRTVKTAEIIAAPLGLSVIHHPDLLDIHYGSFAGLTGEEAQARWPEIYEGWLEAPGSVTFPGGESLTDLRTRTERFMREISAGHPNEIIVAVGHTVANRMILLSTLGLDNDRLWDIGQDNCAINLLEHKKGHWRVISINDTGHLAR